MEEHSSSSSLSYLDKTDFNPLARYQPRIAFHLCKGTCDCGNRDKVIASLRHRCFPSGLPAFVGDLKHKQGMRFISRYSPNDRFILSFIIYDYLCSHSWHRNHTCTETSRTERYLGAKWTIFSEQKRSLVPNGERGSVLPRFPLLTKTFPILYRGWNIIGDSIWFMAFALSFCFIYLLISSLIYTPKTPLSFINGPFLHFILLNRKKCHLRIAPVSTATVHIFWIPSRLCFVTFHYDLYKVQIIEQIPRGVSEQERRGRDCHSERTESWVDFQVRCIIRGSCLLRWKLELTEQRRGQSFREAKHPLSAGNHRTRTRLWVTWPTSLRLSHGIADTDFLPLCFLAWEVKISTILEFVRCTANLSIITVTVPKKNGHRRGQNFFLIFCNLLFIYLFMLLTSRTFLQDDIYMCSGLACHL